MSYGIMPYRANVARVATRFGVKVSKKKSAVRRACEPRAPQIDEIFDNEPPLFLNLVEELPRTIRIRARAIPTTSRSSSPCTKRR